MKKIRSDAKWLDLKPKQLALLEKWLFVDNLDYDTAFKRAKKDFGFTGSQSSLQRFYHRAEQDRQLRELRDTAKEAGQLKRAGVSGDAIRESSILLASRRFFEQMKSDSPADVATLAKLVLASEANQLKREANELRRQSQKMRREQMRIANNHWEFDMVESVTEMMPVFRETMDRLGPRKKKPYKEMINALRMRVFGAAPERISPLPPEPPATAPVPAPAPVGAPASAPLPDPQPQPAGESLFASETTASPPQRII